MRYLALGDSHTSGEGNDPELCWPRLLAALLGCAARPIKQCVVLGRSDWTSRELREEVAGLIRGPFDLVTLQVGLTDQLQERPAAHFLPDFVALLDQAIAVSARGARGVIAVSVPEWVDAPAAAGRNKARIRSMQETYNAAIFVEAKRRGARFVDVRPLAAGALRRGWLAGDGLHLSPHAYLHWAEEILPVAIESIGRRGRMHSPLRGRLTAS